MLCGAQGGKRLVGLAITQLSFLPDLPSFFNVLPHIWIPICILILIFSSYIICWLDLNLF